MSSLCFVLQVDLAGTSRYRDIDTRFGQYLQLEKGRNSWKHLEDTKRNDKNASQPKFETNTCRQIYYS